jgi:hypothetical protein
LADRPSRNARWATLSSKLADGNPAE